MRKALIASVAVVSLIACASAAFATGHGKTLEIRKATGAVTLDGDLKEFLTPAPTGNQIGIHDGVTSTVEAGQVDSAADFSMKFYGLYDDKNIYLGFDVKDDVLVGSQTDGNIWQNDGIEIWFDANNNDETNTECGQVPGEHQIGVTPITADEAGAVGHWVWRSQDDGTLLDSVKVAAKIVKDGYTMEVLIPIAALGADFKTLKPGQQLGFNISAVDNDGVDGDTWDHITWNGTLHSNPQNDGIMLVK